MAGDRAGEVEAGAVEGAFAASCGVAVDSSLGTVAAKRFVSAAGAVVGADAAPFSFVNAGCDVGCVEAPVAAPPLRS